MRRNESPIAGCAIRRSRPTDLEPLAHLLMRAALVEDRAARPASATLLGHGRLFVIDTVTCALGGAIHVDISGELGCIDLLAVDPALSGLRIDGRLYTFAEAVCLAHGCTRLEVAARRFA